MSYELDSYRLEEMEWRSLDDFRRVFQWEVPESFNIARAALDGPSKTHPHRVALYEQLGDGTESIYTFKQVRNYVNQLSNYLREQGVERGDRVALPGNQRIETALGYLAVLKLGAVVVPMSSLFGPEGLKYRLADSGATAIVVSVELIDILRTVREDLPDLESILTVGEVDPEGEEVDFWAAISERSRSFETVETAADDDAAIVYTSGTTGDPKGVVHTHQFLLGVLPVQYTYENLDTENKVRRTVVEWSWIGGFLLISSSWFLGISLVAYDRQEFEPETEFELIETYGITRFAGPNTALRMMMEIDDPSERFELDSVKSVLTAGEETSADTIEWIEATFENAVPNEVYGQTEFSGVFVHSVPSWGIEYKRGTIGKPLLEDAVRLRDPETGELVTEPGEVGELEVREDQPSVFDRYWGKPDRTAGKKRSDGWVRGEDLFLVDEDGYYRFRARTDDVIISSGYRIGPVEVESTLDTHEAVLNAGVIGVPHDTRGEIPKAFVSLKERFDPDPELAAGLKTHVKERLAKYEYPREVEFVEELPTTSTGKLRRKSLREYEGVTDE